MNTDRLLDGFRARQPAALARVITAVENHGPGVDALLAALGPVSGRARRIGITGPPGAGKSTLAMQLIRTWRAQGLTVGVVAVDPTSPFTGGAVLGDRIRMESVALDAGVYIRSLATRGALGGLSAATRSVADVLDAYGFDRIVIETVGVGQSELDVARAADSCVVVLVPESGDSIQTLKAGLMEIADIFVVNKADRPGADRLRLDIERMLKLQRPRATAGNGAGAHVTWVPPVIATLAADGTGVADVAAALDRHHDVLVADDALAARRRASRSKPELLRDEVVAWQARYDAGSTRDIAFANSSGPVKPVYTALDASPDIESLGLPGTYPYTRGIHPTGYRGKLWTMRQFAGFGSAHDTNARYKFLLEHGQTGLSVAFDFPTLMGYDSDHARAEGEVGKCGVAISSLADMEVLFDGIPLGEVSTSMTINGPAIILFAFYVAAAEKQGVPPAALRGTIQNDILKEYMAQHAWVYPVEPALRLIVDCFEWAAEHAPKWNTISISGYHIREAGATAAQELAFTLANGFTYVERGQARGLDVDRFAPQLSFFWDIHNDFFEEIAKLRAARRIWARQMRERYGAKDPRSWMMRFHSQTAGVTLTAQQPMNNIARVAYQAMAAALGGTQSLHTNSMDETLALPTEHAVQVALRTQQILAYETGAANVSDPLAGSYYVEALTDRLEREAEELFDAIARAGGVVRALEDGWFQRHIADSAARHQLEVEEGRRVTVGVNAFETDGDAIGIPILQVGDEALEEQGQRLRELRATRDEARCRATLAALKQAAAEGRNVFPAILDAARAYCTLFEIRSAMEAVFGAYHEPVFF